MLTDNIVKEHLSLAYIQAIASLSGFGVERMQVDIDSVDVSLRGYGWLSEEPGVLWSPVLDVQLKSSAKVEIRDESLLFDLPIKNYNELRIENRHIPALLVLLHLPEQREQWAVQSRQELILRRCAYWYNLAGLPASTNSKTQRIAIPVSNVFSPSALRNLLLRVARQEPL